MVAASLTLMALAAAPFSVTAFPALPHISLPHLTLNARDDTGSQVPPKIPASSQVGKASCYVGTVSPSSGGGDSDGGRGDAATTNTPKLRTRGVHPKLNLPACQYLINTHLPSIMDVNEPGSWSTSQPHQWNLGSDNKGGFQADDCTLQLVNLEAVSGSTEGTTVQFAPNLFLSAANDVLGSCGEIGGKEVLNTTPNFVVSIA